MNMHPIPAQFTDTPIAQLLVNLGETSPKSVNFVNEVIDKLLNNISLEEFNEVREWSGWENREITEMANEDLNYDSNQQFISIQLNSIFAAIHLKKDISEMYPESRIEYNEECTPVDTTWNATRNWLKIDGENAKNVIEKNIKRAE